MATAVKGLPPGHWKESSYALTSRCVDVDENGNKTRERQCRTHEEHMRAEEEAIDSIPPDRIWRTQAGDGYAVYYVKSEKPLKLQHMPTGDAWHAPPALIRGLRLTDVRQEQERDARIKKLFAER